MNDIQFNPGSREILIKNNDFALTQNPSVQNGAILLMSKGSNPKVPWKGVGLLPGIINAAAGTLTYDMNLWRSQAIIDGATLAKWDASVTPNGLAKPDIKVSYL